jgi:hypothetical protein
VNIRDCDVYMVGSMAVPSDSTEEAMQIAAEGLGDRLFALPDGEVGQRSMWVAGLGVLSYYDHPDIEQAGEADGFRPVPGPFGPLGACRIRPGAGEVSLDGHLPYADAALSSFEQFRALKARGDVPSDIRFQVALPTPLAAISPFFGDPAEWAAMKRAYQRGIDAEIDRILEAIPADELSIQWDYCIELCDIVSAASGQRDLAKKVMPWNPVRTAEEAFAEHTALEYIRPLSARLPAEVTFGFHLCLGTFPSFPTTPVDDLEWVVRIAGALVANTPRRVDFVHLPAMADSGRGFFAPLANLEVGDARVFLGIEQRDGVEGIVRRGRAAREFLPEFGISHYCGYGRDDASKIRNVLRDLKDGADQLMSEPAAP